MVLFPRRSLRCIPILLWSCVKVRSMPGTMKNSRRLLLQLARSKLFSLALPLTSVSIFHSISSRSSLLMLISTGTTFLALSLRAAGYSVWANVEASGTSTPLIRDVSNSRMQAAGVQLVSLFSIVCGLMRDWRNTPGSPEVLPFLDKYFPVYSYVARAHLAAIDNGTVIAGEAGLI